MSSHDRSGYIDQWRGISVLMVIVDHLLLFRHRLPVAAFSGSDGVSSAIRQLLVTVDWWSANAGNTGVCIFFVMSGYLITSLLLKEELQTGRASLANFIVRRSFRIFPAMILLLAVVWLLDAVKAIHIEPEDAFGPSLFLCNTTLVQCGHLGHFWSLAVEEQFYLVWPAIFIFVGRGRTAIVVMTLGVALVASTLPQFRIYGWLNNGLAFSCITVGVLYALSERFRSLFTVTTRIPRPLLGLTLAVFIPYARTRWSHYDVAYVLILPFLVVATILVRTGYKRGAIAETLRLLGLISYSLYLWHAVFTWPPESYLSPWFATLSWLAIPAAWLSYRFVEQPMIALGRKLTGVMTRRSLRRSAALRVL